MIKSIALERAAGNEFVPAEGNVGCEGLTPSEMILYAAGKAVGNDIIALLGSVAGRVMSLRITVEGSVVTRGKERSGTYREFLFRYDVVCSDPDDHSRISRAIELAHGKYCALVRMLKMIGPVAYDIYIHSGKGSKVGKEKETVTAN
ncbi:MAG: OsmC family protein [Tidjanibacter sp.]|nr:OsmC family protein [Tidjanibacter sp.]